MDEAIYQDGKYILVRDYTSDRKEEDLTEELAAEPTQEAMAMLDRAVAAYERERARPHAVDPQCAEAFDALVADCNQLMLALQGRIRGAVDYDRRTADIVLECRLLEFLHRRQLDVLHELTARAKQVRFTVLPDQYLQMYTLLPYFNF